VIPEHFRVSFIALVSFFWVIILSSLSAAKDEDAGAMSKTSIDKPITVAVNGEANVSSANRK